MILLDNGYYFKRKLMRFVLLVSIIMSVFLVEAYSVKLKNVAEVEGKTGVQVIGYGLVVGLNQTGDNQLTQYTNQSVINMLKRFGLTTDSRMIRMRNVAAVMVTATIPTFNKKGSKIDVNVSSMGDATSLQGGNLLLTPMSTATGEVIGFAQGPITVGGYDFRSLGSQVTKNFVTSGRVPNGLILEKDITAQFAENEILRLSLRDPDFTTVTRMSEAINELIDLEGSANAIDAGTVEVQFPTGLSSGERIALIAQVENVEIDLDPSSRVVINERTGTVVVGGNVRILPAVVSHGGLEINIQRQVVVPQPAPFTILPPRIAETAEIEASEEINPATPIEIDDATVDDMANALNLLQVKPRDMIAIFQALKQAGALQGELIVQ